jgi:site-specific recombinase XerD
MLLIPKAVFVRYVAQLKTRGVAAAYHADYQKWLRYFLDFCDKYPNPAAKSERVRLFCEKLREKKQSLAKREQAAHAVSLYFEMVQQEPLKRVQDNTPSRTVEMAAKMVELPEATSAISLNYYEESRKAPVRSPFQFTEAGYQVKSKSSEWDAVLETMAAEIKVRHYSRKTLKTYANWSRCFQRFLKDKMPAELTTNDVKEYLTFMAVKCNVAASTQNQAFNSLLFLFRHGLKRDFGELRGVPRAKKSLYIPVVLS